MILVVVVVVVFFVNKLRFSGEEIKNIRQYLERIRQEYWPDWDSLLCKK